MSKTCPACGSDKPDVCELMGHTYPVTQPSNDDRFVSQVAHTIKQIESGMEAKVRMTQPCGTCKWAQFKMTNHTPPRVNPRQYGSCKWPVPQLIPLARCLTSLAPQHAHRSVIWANDTGCPVWESK